MLHRHLVHMLREVTSRLTCKSYNKSCASPAAVQVNEGYPMAAPTSTVLQATKRATRYWPLYSQVQAAVTAAFASQAGASTAVPKDPLDDINSLPGMDCPLGTTIATAAGQQAAGNC